MDKLSTGAECFDELLDGGYEKDIITTVYGPAGAGKTCLCLLAAIQAAKDKKIIYIDTEGGFSASRLKQLTPHHKEVLDKIFFLRPTNFEAQKEAFEKLRSMINDKIGLVIVDTISMLYRLELGKDSVYDVNRDLGKQLSYLVEIARKHSIPVLLTNQVYADFANKEKTNMVGGDILKYSSKCLMELSVIGESRRKAVIRKHRYLPYKELVFQIKEEGLVKFQKPRGFGLF